MKKCCLKPNENFKLMEHPQPGYTAHRWLFGNVCEANVNILGCFVWGLYTVPCSLLTLPVNITWMAWLSKDVERFSIGEID